MRTAASSLRTTLGIAIALFSLAGCQSSTTEVPKESTPIDAATAGSIKVSVNYRGRVPAAKEINMQTAAECAQAHPSPVLDERIRVQDGKVENAVVWIKSGLEKFVFAPPKSAVTVDQEGCLFKPRVAAAMTHQPIEFRNSDFLAHNVHGEPKIVSAFNFMMSRKGVSREVTFEQAEVGVPVTCDVHPWMRASLAILANPYFAVTPASGSVELTNVPPGDYVVAAWQEKAGTVEERVHLDPSAHAEISVTLPEVH